MLPSATVTVSIDTPSAIAAGTKIDQSEIGLWFSFEVVN